ncbi:MULTISPECIES: sensor histidine kinase [Nocardia]|uniref:sensor histidine kinase n=1 Tax=Nocardia TaxID=1817 RepID=UPI001E5A0DF0|nr:MULTISPECIES: ATP-binding protein [Nocardia]UEX22616.1 ATP-binding protein [Nocardia farcinica]
MSESSMPSADGAAVSGEPGRAAFVVIPVLGLALGAGPAAAAMSLIPQERLRIPFAATGAALGVLVTAALLAAVWYRRKARSALRAAAAAELHRDAAEDQRLEAEKRAAAVESMIAEERAATTRAIEVARRDEHHRTAALAAFAGAAGRIQAMTTAMLAELREMEHRHDDPKVLADLLLLDHRTAQAGRLADSIAVLSGARSGRRWAKPISMESILRGAMGRVAGYQRVRLRAVAEIAVAGHAAEGVMHALAELLDNACNFSPPTTEVHVYASEVPAGVVVTIEDSGLVMSESALRRAELAVSGARDGDSQADADLAALTGTRLGLAVVGHLARKHGLTVSYRPSAIGGTAVVVVVPRELTARLARVEPASLPAGRPAAASEPEPVVVSGADAPLPKRQRGRTLAAAHPEGLVERRPGAATVRTPAAPTTSSARPAALGAFQRAVAGHDTEDQAPPSTPVALENER